MKQEKESNTTENRRSLRRLVQINSFKPKMSIPRRADSIAENLGRAARWTEGQAESIASREGSARVQEAAEQFFAKQNPEEAIEVLADRGLKEQATKVVSAVAGHLAEFAESVAQHLH